MGVDLRCDGDIGVAHEPRSDIDRNACLLQIRAVGMPQIIHAHRWPGDVKRVIAGIESGVDTSLYAGPHLPQGRFCMISSTHLRTDQRQRISTLIPQELKQIIRDRDLPVPGVSLRQRDKPIFFHCLIHIQDAGGKVNVPPCQSDDLPGAAAALEDDPQEQFVRSAFYDGEQGICLLISQRPARSGLDSAGLLQILAEVGCGEAVPVSLMEDLFRQDEDLMNIGLRQMAAAVQKSLDLDRLDPADLFVADAGDHLLIKDRHHVLIP